MTVAGYILALFDTHTHTHTHKPLHDQSLIILIYRDRSKLAGFYWHSYKEYAITV